MKSVRLWWLKWQENHFISNIEAGQYLKPSSLKSGIYKSVVLVSRLFFLNKAEKCFAKCTKYLAWLRDMSEMFEFIISGMKFLWLIKKLDIVKRPPRHHVYYI